MGRRKSSSIPLNEKMIVNGDLIVMKPFLLKKLDKISLKEGVYKCINKLQLIKECFLKKFEPIDGPKIFQILL